MTKEEVLAIIEVRIAEAIDHKRTLRKDSGADCVNDAGIAVLEWARDLVKQIEVEPRVIQKAPRQSSGDQNTVATGWHAAVTGELKKKR